MFGRSDAFIVVSSGWAVGITVSGLELCITGFQQLPDLSGVPGFLVWVGAD